MTTKTKSSPKSAAKTSSRKSSPKPQRKTKSPIAAAPAAPKTNKSTTLRELLQRAEGATLAEMMDATDWQAHTVRAWLSRGGGSPAKPGPEITRDKETGRYHQAVVSE